MICSLSICIATYKRPHGLEQLLTSLNQLKFHLQPPPTVEVLVADNDAAGSARAICDAIRPQFRWPLVYEVEPQQGVSFARNRSVAMASPSTEFIVFIDDDEFPDPLWLDQLLTVQHTYQADVVTGPVLPKFEANPIPSWILEGGFFDPPQRDTGTALHIAYTHNALVRADCLRHLEPLFDPAFALRGSEDAHLFMRLFHQGATFIWAQEAVVYETIPVSRTQLKWLLDRNFYGWSSHSLLEKSFYPSLPTQSLRFAKGALLLSAGLAATPLSLLAGKLATARALILLYRGLGTLAGLFGTQGRWDGARRQS